MQTHRKGLAAGVALACAAAGMIVVATAEAEPAGPCATLDRSCIVEVATTYIDAQLDYSKRDSIRLAPTAQRWENGYSNGANADEIRGGDPGPFGIDALLDGPRDIDRVLVDESRGEAVFFWIIDVRAPVGSDHIATAHIAERFRVEEGVVCGAGLSPCITEIEAIFCIGHRGDEAAMPSPEDRPPVSNILCHRAG